MMNFTEDDSVSSSQHQTSPFPPDIAAFLIALNIFLSIATTLGNALILIALRKVTSLHPPTKLLFRCLAVTDLCVGLISQPLYSILLFLIVSNINLTVHFYVLQLNIVSSSIFVEVSALISAAIRVDRLLALSLRLRYRHVVTLNRVRATTICFWLIGFSVGFLHFLSRRITFPANMTTFIISVVISVVSYTKILLRLRQQNAQVQGNVHQGQPKGGGIPLNKARYNKTVSSIAWMQLASVVCYVPFVTFVVMIKLNGWSGTNARIVWRSAVTLAYINSSLNPLFYCWKIAEVRQAVKDTVKQFVLCYE